MKATHTLLISMISFSALFSCQNEKSESKNGAEKQKESSEVSLSDFEERAKNPCNFIDEAMVTKHFDVSAEDLEKDEYVKEKLSWMDHCTYKWEKEDIDAINKRNQKIIMDAMKSGDTKNAVKAGMSVEQTHKFVGVTNLKLYDDIDKATKYFENSHKKPSQEDLEKLNEEFNKQADKKGLSEKQKEVGKDLGGGISDNLKFKKIEGLGDYAYWDDLGSKVDVLIGKIQFGVKIHTGEGVEKDIEMGTLIAKEIISKL
jgi:hypothetical protein